jgi:hypothetical protein
MDADGLRLSEADGLSDGDLDSEDDGLELGDCEADGLREGDLDSEAEALDPPENGTSVENVGEL